MLDDLGGSGGGGSSLWRSQPEAGEASQSRMICLSKDGWFRPGCHSSAGQKREESGVSTSSPITSSPSSRPNSNLVSARMIPRSRAMSRARPYTASVVCRSVAASSAPIRRAVSS